jgi:hypothetical protein
MTLNNAGICTDSNRPTLPYSHEVIDTLIGFIAQNTHFSLVCVCIAVVRFMKCGFFSM